MNEHDYSDHRDLLRLLRDIIDDARSSETVKAQADDYHEKVLKHFSERNPLSDSERLKMWRFIDKH